MTESNQTLPKDGNARGVPPGPSSVVFLLGAGASVKAGVPDTYQFVAQFIESLSGDPLQEPVQRLVTDLDTWAKTLGRAVDIEMLLETFTGLREKGSDPAMGICRGNGDNYLTSNMLHRLIARLKDFIKQKAIVDESSVGYLDPLRGFLLDDRPLDIISVNYDTCMEQFCNSRRLALEDGFDVRWNAANFEREHTDFRLYKLHGSVTWFQSDRGGYLKLPVMTPESQIKLITGEQAQNLMLYPMQKWGYAEPLLELLLIVKHTLESQECKFLVSAGYSFRDEHIRTILWDAARRNQALHLLLVDPQAHNIYTNRLRFYDSDHKVPTPLDKRVVCLPYKFEEALPLLRTHFLHNLRVGLQAVAVQRTNELEGKDAHWQQAISTLVEAEHNELATDLLPKYRQPEGPAAWGPELGLSLKLAWHAALTESEADASKWTQRFTEILRVIMHDHIGVEILRSNRVGGADEPSVRVWFGFEKHDGGASMLGDGAGMLKLLDPLLEFSRAHERMALSTPPALLAAHRLLDDVVAYCRELGEGIEFKRYVDLRHNEDVDGVRLSNYYTDFRDNRADGARAEVAVATLEQRVIAKLLAPS